MKSRLEQQFQIIIGFDNFKTWTETLNGISATLLSALLKYTNNNNMYFYNLMKWETSKPCSSYSNISHMNYISTYEFFRMEFVEHYF